MARLVFRLWLTENGFTPSKRQATSKPASAFLSAPRLLPRLEELYIRRVHYRQPPRFARRGATNSHTTRRWLYHTPQGARGFLRFTACVTDGCEVASERSPLAQ